jgi:hypothetical protein
MIYAKPNRYEYNREKPKPLHRSASQLMWGGFGFSRF